MKTMRPAAAAAAAALILAAALTGCTPTGAAVPQAEGTGGSGDDARFVACLQGEGLDAKILEDGRVAVRIGDAGDEVPAPPDPGAGDVGWVSMGADADGLWQAVQKPEGFSESSGIREPYTACLEKVPGFEQPEDKPDDFGPDPQLVEANLAFAKCARENGLADFEDPEAPGGALVFPADITADQFRAVISACGDTIADVGFAATTAMDELSFDWKAVLEDVLGQVRISITSRAS